jgi:hypothetical protein
VERSVSFWEPVLRAWLMALPYFAVGMIGAIIQLRRLRQHVTNAIGAAVAEQGAAITQRVTDAVRVRAGAHERSDR